MGDMSANEGGGVLTPIPFKSSRSSHLIQKWIFRIFPPHLLLYLVKNSLMQRVEENHYFSEGFPPYRPKKIRI